MGTESGLRNALAGFESLSSVDVVACCPARGDVAVLRGGRVRWTVTEVDEAGRVQAIREETARDGGFQACVMVVSLPAWCDLVHFGACSASSASDEEIENLFGHARGKAPGGSIEKA